VADHAGSGKTLAYLLPFLQGLRAEEALLGTKATQPSAPRLVVICPTEELCQQVVVVCRGLAKVRGSHCKRSVGHLLVTASTLR
jgi:ATP-dependent RNA helicase DDX18/HAS1